MASVLAATSEENLSSNDVFNPANLAKIEVGPCLQLLSYISGKFSFLVYTSLR